MLEHLRGRPIAPIVNASEEKDDGIALKMMCIVDFTLESSGFYQKMKSMPKLMGQLLNFHSFAAFKYIKYVKETTVIDKALQCKFCELIGPYTLVLEHMVINHGYNASAVKCMFCNDANLQDHNDSGTLHGCYENYKAKFSNLLISDVIVEFYDLLKKLAKQLNVQCSRNKQFKNAVSTFARIESIASDAEGDISNEVIVSVPKKRKCKGIDLRPIDKLYRKAMLYFHKQRAHEYTDTTPGMRAASTSQPVFEQFNSGLNSGLNRTSQRLNNANDSINFTSSLSFAPQDTAPTLHTFDMPSSSTQFTTSPPLNLPEFPPMPTFGMATPASCIGNSFISALENIQNEQIKKQATSAIRRIIMDSSVKDLAEQMKDDDANA